MVFALPWLVNRHANPWTTFYTDVAMVVAVLLPAIWLRSGPGTLPVSRAALFVAFLSLMPLAQAAAGLYAFASDALLPFAYLAVLAMAIMVGHGAELRAPGRLIDTLFAGLVIAGIVSTGLALAQWQQLDLGVLAVPLPLGGRPVANLAQPNLLATLIAWALGGLWWGFATARIGSRAAILGAAFLLLGIAATQSRTGWLEVAVLALAATFAPSGPARLPWQAVLALAMYFALVVMSWPQLTGALQLDMALSLAQQWEPGRRPAIWAQGLDAITTRPWFGFGWGNSVAAQVDVAAGHPPLLYALVSHHNLLLDIAVWAGVPLLFAATLGLATWLMAQWSAARSARQWILLVTVLLLLVHSMLELPHCYAVFIVPAGLMAGTLEALRSTRPAAVLPRWAASVLLVATVGLLTIVMVEYARIERDLLEQRIRAARIGSLDPAPPPPTQLLGALGGLMHFLRTEPQPRMADAELADMRRVAYRFPSAANLFRYAQAAALNGHAAAAGAALDLLCRVNAPSVCESAGKAWDELARTQYPTMLSVQPATAPH